MLLKRLAGYTIQGDKTEERILLLYGPGNAGKGTFMDWFMNALGPDYACAMDANSVLKQKRDSAAASGDIARLEGKRLVVVSEIEKGSRLQESFMKQASGNDAMVARGLYQSEREFQPTHQFWFQTNYRPGFDSTDSGNKRRYIEVPFDNDLRADPLVTFDSKIKIKIKMRNDPDFLRAVLAWAVAGCIEWHQHGLEIPKSVQDATDALFAHNDFLKNFLTECCTRMPIKPCRIKNQPSPSKCSVSHMKSGAKTKVKSPRRDAPLIECWKSGASSGGRTEWMGQV
jgi:putative DNA primase/helicase